MYHHGTILALVPSKHPQAAATQKPARSPSATRSSSPLLLFSSFSSLVRCRGFLVRLPARHASHAPFSISTDPLSTLQLSPPFFRCPLTMYLAPITFSSLLVASSVAALRPPHDLAGRLAKTHSNLARDIKTSFMRAASPVMADKGVKNKKKRAATTKQFCRVRPTSRLGASTELPTSPVRHPPTTTGTGVPTRATSITRPSSTGAQPTDTTGKSPWKLKVTNVSCLPCRSGQPSRAESKPGPSRAQAESKPSLTFADSLSSRKAAPSSMAGTSGPSPTPPMAPSTTRTRMVH